MKENVNMCIIIAKPRHVELPPIEHIEESWDSNPHGFACVWSNNGVIKSYATLNREACINFYRSLNRKVWKKIAASFHFRYATHGSKTKENCHAYVDKDRTIGFQHNGILRYSVPRDMDITDSEYFFRFMFLPIYESNRRLMNFDHVIENMKGGGDKFCFVKDGEIYTYGGFIKDGGCWYSNNCYVRHVKPAVQIKKSHSSKLKVYNYEKKETLIGKSDYNTENPCSTCTTFDCLRCDVSYDRY